MSKPFLCPCGKVVDVEEFARGERFRCPACASEHVLDPDDPGLLSDPGTADGVYGMLLRRRIVEDPDLPPAIRVSAPAAAPAVAEATPPPRRTLGDTRSAAPGSLMLSVHEAAGAPTVESGLRAGTQLGPYRIESVLGRGGMGVVYRAHDTSLDRKIALKVLTDDHARNAEVVDRFRREARAAGSLNHPNITHIYSIGSERGVNYFAMELIEGRTLAEVLATERVLGEQQAIDFLLQIARGLRAALHKKIIHRDIKPSNLILSRDGLVKITDFGLAKVITSAVDITATGVIIGTPLYMSPEQGKGEALDHRADIYSLGCTFYHLLAGAPPFRGDSAMNIIVQHITEEAPPLTLGESPVEARLATIVQRMIRKNPLDRFQDYDELLAAVTEAAGAGGSSSRLEGTPSRVVLVAEHAEEPLPRDAMSRKQLSVADVNLELGRLDKALALYQRVLEENPQLEVELSLRMLPIHQQRGNSQEAERLYRRILALSTDPRERFFCRWKLLAAHYDRSLAELREARQVLEDLLADEIPAPVQARRLQQRLDYLVQAERRLLRDREAGIVLIRKVGDLQIELD